MAVSTLTVKSGRLASRTVAIVTALLVALSGLLLVPAAHAEDGPSISVTPSEQLDPSVANELTVTGTGFVGAGAAVGAYVLFGDKNIWSGNGPLVGDGWLAQVHVSKDAMVNGSFTTTIVVPAGSLDPAKQYHVATSAAHWLSVSDRTLDTFFPVTVAQPVQAPAATTIALSASAPALISGEPLTLSATVAPADAAGAVVFLDNGTQLGQPQPVASGVATLATTELAVGSHSFTAAFTPADSAAFAPSTSAAVQATVTEAPTAQPKPKVSASVTGADAEGLKVSATVENIVLRLAADVPDSHKDDAGVYVGIIDKNRVDEYRTSSSAGAFEDFAYKVFIKDGNVTRNLAVPAGKLDRTKQYVAVSWLAHGMLSDARYLGQADLEVSAAQWDAVFGKLAEKTTVTLTGSAASVSDGHTLGLSAKVAVPTANSSGGALPIGALQFFEDGKSFGAALKVSLANNAKEATVATVSPKIADGKHHAFSAVFTPLDEQAYAGATSNDFGVTGTAKTGPWTPAIKVFVKVNGTEVPHSGQKVYRGDEIVVRGSGFDPEANVGGRGVPVPVGPQGSYVLFSSFAENNWQPSTGAGPEQRGKNDANQGWVLSDSAFASIPPNFKPAVEKQLIRPTPDGSFEWSTKLTTPSLVTNGKFGVYTLAAGGAVNPAEELEVIIDYVDAARPGSPSIEAFLPDGSKYEGQKMKDGDKLVVKGTGFDPYANLPASSEGGAPIPNSLPQGTFAVFGSFASDWKPSAGKGSETRAMNPDSRLWLLAEDTLGKVPNAAPTFFQDQIRKQWVPLSSDDGTFEATITLKAPKAPVAGGSYGIYTYAGGAGQVANAAQELAIAVNFADGNDGGEIVDPAKGALQWGVMTRFVKYIESNADGKVSVHGAATRGGGSFGFPQVKGGDWNPDTGLGSVRYGGGVSFSAHDGALGLSILDPVITVTGAKSAVLSATVDGNVQRLVDIDLSSATRTVGAGGGVTWAGAKTKLHADSVDAFQSYEAGQAFDDITFTVGAAGDGGTTIPPKPTKPAVKPAVKPPKAIGGSSQQAGSLSWGISSGFTGYVTGRIAKGSISTNGVGNSGGNYLFPQANGGSWDAASQTGSVQFSGVVTFEGHNGLLSESFANPVISVTSANEGTISAGGRTFGLNLGSASKTVGAAGEVTWSGVPVAGAISGGGSTGAGSGSGSFAVDSLSFTVGAPSTVSFGSTTQTEKKAARVAATEAPTTEGIKVITPADEIVPGGQIEFSASGFEANEHDVLVVLYSDPIVLDEKAGASAYGEVRWIGTLPKDIELGKHVITLQGSKDAGAEITVVKPIVKKKDKPVIDAKTAEATAPMAATVVPESGTGPVWLWWAGAVGLLVLAGGMGGLVANQRRQAANANVDVGVGN